MVKFSLVAAVGAILSASAANAASIYQQCGGIGWTGSTVCDAGLACVILNAYYFQCLTPAAGQTTTGSGAPVTTAHSSTTTSSLSFSFSGSSHSGTTLTTATTATKTTTTPSTTTSQPAISVSGRTCAGPRTKFKFFGVNESGAEFGNTAWPGQLGKDYTWPSPSSVDYFMGNGFNTFRITFLMERMSPPATGLTGPFNQTYLSGLTTIVDYITNKGGYALIDPHNFMRYNNAVISSTSDFATWWKNLATVFKSVPNAVFDIQNEPYGIDAQTVYQLNQAAINSIRAAGATSQLILVEGTSYTGAWTWVSSGNSAAFAAVTDPYNNTAIEMHQYLDSDGSGTSEDCVSSTIGSQRLQAATAWLKQTGLKGFLGETGAGSNSVCIDAVFDELCYMQQQGGAWIGALWWAAGPWWGDYIYSIEPPSGAAIPEVLPQALEPFL